MVEFSVCLEMDGEAWVDVEESERMLRPSRFRARQEPMKLLSPSPDLSYATQAASRGVSLRSASKMVFS